MPSREQAPTSQAKGSADAIAPSAFEPLGQAAAVPTTSAHHPLRWLLASCVAFFILVMAFLLSARSLEIIVVAHGSPAVHVTGLAIPFGDRYLLRPGEHTVSASASGYHPLSTQVTVGNGDSQRVELVLQPLPGLISLDAQPTAADVWIDDKAVGSTPIKDLKVETGTHQLRFSADRYQSETVMLNVTGRSLAQHLAVTLTPAWAAVTIVSNPAGAIILIDGENRGSTPAQLDLIQGERQLMLQLTGYADWQQSLEITANEAQDLGNIALQAAAGVLELSSRPPGANVTLDGEFQGQTPLALELQPNKQQRLAVFKPGYRRHIETVQLASGETAPKELRLRAQLGEIRFNLAPAGATLWVDGKPHGAGSQVLSLPAIEHKIEVVLDGYASAKRRITPRPGLQQLVEINLKSAEAVRLASLKPEVITALGQTMRLFKPADSPLSDFTMGASRREPGRRANEVLHPVSLRRMFYLQTTEVSNAQFRQFEKAHNSGQIEGNSLNREQQPVVQISWQQAASFCNWLSKREGLPLFYRETNGIIGGYNPSATGYRLPTEAEWAWTARTDGDALLKFPWGDSFPPTASVENYADSSSAYITGRALSGYQDGHVVTAPVASFSPSAKGLYDIGGNVAEWIHDVYHIPSGNGQTEEDPLGAQSGDNYVIRGASWSQSRITQLRLAYRDYGQSGRDDVGFRIARYAK